MAGTARHPRQAGNFRHSPPNPWHCLNFKVERLALRGAVGSQRDPSHQIKTLLNRLPFGIGDDYIME